jgi:hypothetical protein
LFITNFNYIATPDISAISGTAGGRESVDRWKHQHGQGSCVNTKLRGACSVQASPVWELIQGMIDRQLKVSRIAIRCRKVVHCKDKRVTIGVGCFDEVGALAEA